MRTAIHLTVAVGLSLGLSLLVILSGIIGLAVVLVLGARRLVGAPVRGCKP